MPAEFKQGDSFIFVAKHLRNAVAHNLDNLKKDHLVAGILMDYLGAVGLADVAPDSFDRASRRFLGEAHDYVKAMEGSLLAHVTDALAPDEEAETAADQDAPDTDPT